MPREMTFIDPYRDEPSYKGTLKDVERGKLKQLAAVSSIKAGFADLYQLGYGRSEEYLIVVGKVGGVPIELWIGGKTETGRTWRVLAKHIASTVL